MNRYLPLLLVSLTFACASSRRTPEPILSVAGTAESLVLELVEEGNRLLQKNHLFGWRQAELNYEQAYGLVEQAELRNRLVLTQFLIITRELEEGLLYDRHLDRLSKLCSGVSTALQVRLCQAAREELRLAGVMEGRPPDHQSELGVRTSGLIEPDLADYISLVILERTAPHLYMERLEGFLVRYPSSLLSIYLKRKLPGYSFELEGSLQREVDFAELIFSEGLRLLAENELEEGFGLMIRGFDLIPDHTVALTDLADVYLYNLGMAGLAKDYYSRALRTDSKSVRARFSLGVASHQLGEYVESNLTLDRVLGSTGTRWKALSADQQSYYQGVGSYYKAYNLYVLEERAEVRSWVDRALQLQPGLEAARYLSGILYYDRELHHKAESEFERVIEGGTDLCDAFYRLARIQGKRNEESMLQHFMNNANCLDRRIRLAEKQLEAVDDFGLDPDSSERLRKVREEHLAEQRIEALSSLVSMLDWARTSESARSLALTDTIEGVVARVETQ